MPENARRLTLQVGAAKWLRLRLMRATVSLAVFPRLKSRSFRRKTAET
jgi:hypothetical protein